MPQRPVTVGLIQMRCSANPATNLEKALQRIGDAAANGAQIVCLPELFRSLYFCQTEDHCQFDLAEPIPGPTTVALSEAARQHNIVLVSSLFERRAPGLYHNTAVLFNNDGSTLGMYRKMHIPDDPRYYEKFYFTPGDLGFKKFDSAHGPIGTCVCWDQWYPEAARLTALAGAQILFYPTAIGWLAEEKAEYGTAQHAAWETMMRSHAIANGVFVVAVNRTGIEYQPGNNDNATEFWGASFVADPNGNILARGSHEAEETLLVECDLNKIDVVRTHWPFLRDRRIDAYQNLVKRYIDE